MRKLEFILPIISCVCIGIVLASIVVTNFEIPKKILIAFTIILYSDGCLDQSRKLGRSPI